MYKNNIDTKFHQYEYAVMLLLMLTGEWSKGFCAAGKFAVISIAC